MRRSVVTALLVGLPAILVACGGGNTGTSSTPASGGTTSSCPAGSGSSGTTHLKIGSKGFAEEQLLATMTKLVLEAHGFTVDYTFQAKDKAIGQALTGGTIDM